MSTITPHVHAYNFPDEAAKPSSTVNPVKQNDSTDTGTGLSSSSKTSASQQSSSESGDLPGTYLRDPRVPLNRLSEQAGTTDSTEEGSLLDAAREDIRHAVDVAAQYLPESVVEAFGSVFRM